MICENCKVELNYFIDAKHGVGIQGLRCPICGLVGVVATYMEEIYCDPVEYSLYIRNVSESDIEIIRLVSKTACVNYLTAKKMLAEKELCILKAKAPEIKETIAKMQKLDIDYYISPSYKY